MVVTNGQLAQLVVGNVLPLPVLFYVSDFTNHEWFLIISEGTVITGSKYGIVQHDQHFVSDVSVNDVRIQNDAEDPKR